MNQRIYTGAWKHRLQALFIIIALATVFTCTAQSKWVTDMHANLGCNVFLNLSRAQKFPGFRLFSALSLTGTYNKHYILHYGPSISIYTKTVGANLNPLVGDIQIDFTNTISIGTGWGNTMSYMKQLRTLHSGDFYNLVTNQRYGLFLSTNFLLNNHKRNQILGAVTVSAGDLSINYNNDGVPFRALALADGFDRYWTGGGTMFIHHAKGFNRVELGYDQFTGYKPLLYELANIIGINIPLYGNSEVQDSTGKRKSLPNNFNTSMYQLKIGTGRYSSFDIGFVGSMIDSKGKFWGVQDWIHLKGRYPFHPNKDKTRFFIGGTYTNLQKVKL